MILVALFLGLALVAVVTVFNRAVALRRLTENAWSDVDVFLRRRADLIPNLVTTVKGAAAFEQTTLEQLAEARTRALGATSTSDRGDAERTVSSALSQVVGLAESYPVLQANQSFLGLQANLIETERHLADARRYYNACVRDYNTMIEAFPGALIAPVANLRPKDFFELDDLTVRQAPEVGGL